MLHLLPYPGKAQIANLRWRGVIPMVKFQNKYRISSARLQTWDYGSNAAYFVTICTANRACFFGDVHDGETLLSEIGKMAEKYWLEIPDHFPFVKLDVHVVMPNHVHGIIIIDKPNDGRNGGGNAGGAVGKNGTGDASGTVETQNFVSLPKTQPPTPPISSPPPPSSPKNQFGPQSKNLASIIRGHKTGVTKYSRNNNIEFEWQSRFHDHIIRNHASYLRIRNYIINNPIKWENDKMCDD